MMYGSPIHSDVYTGWNVMVFDHMRSSSGETSVVVLFNDLICGMDLQCNACSQL